MASTAWADDEDTPPGFEGEVKASENAPPPGFEEEADRLASELNTSAKVELDADEPDLTLRLAEGLREGIQDAQITTQSETLYSSAARFEDLPLSAEILQGLYVEMKFEKPSKIQAITLPMVWLVTGTSFRWMHGTCMHSMCLCMTACNQPRPQWGYEQDLVKRDTNVRRF